MALRHDKGKVYKRPKHTVSTGSAYWVGQKGFAGLKEARKFAAEQADDRKIPQYINRESDGAEIEVWEPDHG